MHLDFCVYMVHDHSLIAGDWNLRS